MRKFKLLRDIPDHKSDTLFVIHENSMDIIGNLGTFHTNSGWIYSFVKGNLHNPDWFEEVKESKRWRAEKGGQYFYINSEGDIDMSAENSNCFHNWRYKSGNCFQTVEQANEHLEILEIENQLRELADWDGRRKSRYIIFCDYESDVKILCTGVNCGERYYFQSEESAQAAIDKIGEDRLIKYFNYKWY